jgi:hypothetical protein
MDRMLAEGKCRHRALETAFAAENAALKAKFADAANSSSRTVWSSARFTVCGCLQGLRQRAQKLFRPFDVALAQAVDPADAFGDIFIAKSLCKFAMREPELGRPRSDKSANGQIGFHLKNPPSVRRLGGLARG